MLMMLASVRNGHGLGAADAHDAGVWCGMECGRGS